MSEQTRRRKLLEEIARANGETVEHVEARHAGESAATSASDYSALAPTFEEKVLLRLNVIAWSAAIVAIVTVIGVIVAINVAAHASL